jgi:hypothetical protein
MVRPWKDFLHTMMRQFNALLVTVERASLTPPGCSAPNYGRKLSAAGERQLVSQLFCSRLR